MIYHDQLGREVDIPESPKKIVSLVPSITELLFDLGLENHVVGRTKFCIHPGEKVTKVPTIGGVMGFNYHRIEEIDPDLVLGSKEENGEQEIYELAKLLPVWVSDVNNLNDALEMISSIGTICGVESRAEELIQKIKEAFETLHQIPEDVVSAAYLVWRNPLYTVGKGTFTNDMLRRAGIKNVFADKEKSYPVVNEKEIRDRKPDYIFLPSEPYPFKKKDLDEFREKFPGSEIRQVDGEYFSWYGSHLLKAPSYFKQLF